MISFNEIRVGNLVLRNGGNIHKITPFNIAQIQTGEFSAEAIPLTVDWLIALGFTKEESDVNWTTDATYDLFGGPGIVVSFNHKTKKLAIYHIIYEDAYYNYHWPVIETVHRLQNYYFATIEKELIYKP